MATNSTAYHKQTLLEKIDIFGIGIAIRFNQSPSHNTGFGGLVTVSILVLISLFAQDNPSVIYSDDYSSQPEPFYIRPDTFNLALGLQDAIFNQFMDETIYKVRATQQTLVKVFNKETNDYDPKWTFTPIKMAPCKKENFQIDGTQEYFLKLAYQTMYCFDLKEDQAVIEGEFSAAIYKAIVLEFIECIGDGCATPEKKAPFLNGPTLGLFMSNKIIQITNKDTPEMPVGKNLYWLNGPSLQKYITLNLVNTYINSDFKFYGKEYTKQRVVAFSSTAEQVLPRTNEVMFRLTLVYEKNREINYYRRYLKLDEAFSQLGGMFNALLTVGFVICSPFSQLELNRKLLNSIFNISEGSEGEDKENNENNNANNIKSLIQDNDIMNKKNSEIDKNPQNNQPTSLSDNNLMRSRKASKGGGEAAKKPNQQEMIDNIKRMALSSRKKEDVNTQVKNFFKIQFSELQIKFKDYLYNYLSFFFKCFETKRQKLITYGTNKLYSQIDIFHIMNKMIEVEKLKHLLLNESQIKLFEYLPRPVLKIDDMEKEEEKEMNELDKKLKYQTKDLNKQGGSIVDDQMSMRSRANSKFDRQKFSYLGQEDRSQLEKAQDAQRAFHAILKGSGKKSKIDEKLIRMLDTKLVNLFIENSFDFQGGKKNEDENDSELKIEDSYNNLQPSMRNKKKSLFNRSEMIIKSKIDTDEDSNVKSNNATNYIINSPKERQSHCVSPRQSISMRDEKDAMNNHNEDFQHKEQDFQSDYQLMKRTTQGMIPVHLEKSHKVEPKSLDNQDQD